VILVNVAAGTRGMPHVHPEDRIYTAISGVFISASVGNSKKRIKGISAWSRHRFFLAIRRTFIGQSQANTSFRLFRLEKGRLKPRDSM
jgi:hypothetical protein